MFFQNGEGREKFEKIKFSGKLDFGEMQLCRDAKLQVSVIPYFMAGSMADMSQPQQLCSRLPRQTGEFTP